MVSAPTYTQASVKGYNSEGKLQDYVSDEEYYDDIDPCNNNDEDQKEVLK